MDFPASVEDNLKSLSLRDEEDPGDVADAEDNIDGDSGTEEDIYHLPESDYHQRQNEQVLPSHILVPHTSTIDMSQTWLFYRNGNQIVRAQAARYEFISVYKWDICLCCFFDGFFNIFLLGQVIYRSKYCISNEKTKLYNEYSITVN